MKWRLAAALAVWMAALPGARARADSILTKAGGVLRGELLTPGTELATSPEITIRTVSGATVTLARNEVDHILRRSPIAEEYDVRRRAAVDTGEAQWLLALWCDQNELLEERDIHLHRVIDFERNHKGARRMLGHYLHDGRWRKPGEHMNDRGSVRVKGLFRLPPDWDAFQNGALSAAEKDWAERVRALHVRMKTERRGAVGLALVDLARIRDPEAVPALEHYMQGQGDRSARLIVLEIISLIPGEKSLEALVSRSLDDARTDLREAALGAVLKRETKPTVDLYCEALRDPRRIIVTRAAYALGVIGDADAVLPLSQALSTPEEFEEWTLGTDTLIKGRSSRDEENPEVLRALILLTGRNFGYDQAAWRRWHVNARNLSDRN